MISSPLRTFASAAGLRHQIDAFGRAAGEDDFPAFAGVQELLHLALAPFVSRGGPFAQLVHAAVDIGVVVLVVARDGLEDRIGFWVVAALSR